MCLRYPRKKIYARTVIYSKKINTLNACMWCYVLYPTSVKRSNTYDITCVVIVFTECKHLPFTVPFLGVIYPVRKTARTEYNSYENSILHNTVRELYILNLLSCFLYLMIVRNQHIFRKGVACMYYYYAYSIFPVVSG